MKETRKGVGWCSVDWGELLQGAGLVLFSILLLPRVLNIHSLHVLDHMERALVQREPVELLSAALRLVFLNIVRGIPHYVGVFLIGESVELRRPRIPKALLNLVLTFVLLRLTYWGIELVHHIRYDFGIPAVCVGLFAILFGTLNYRYLPRWKKAMMIALALTPLQFLDIVPALRHLPVGRGETSTDVKTAALLLENERMLNSLGLFGLLLSLLFAILILKQLRDENMLRELASLREQNEEIRTQARISEIRSRTYEEIQYLVHDVKSPLTAIQTMAEVMRMERELEGDGRDEEYLERILDCVEQIDHMVSEILHEDKRFLIDTQALLDSVLSQTSILPFAPSITAENRAPGAKVLVNRVLLSRALVNLLQNAAQAVPEGREPKICLRAEAREGRVCFSVSDNGSGIPKKQRERVWDRGTSGKGSSGLGLAFVRKVVEQMEGELSLESTPGKGTRVKIFLQQEGDGP